MKGVEHCTYYQIAEVKKKQEKLDEKKWATRKCKNNKEKWEANCDGGGPSGVCLNLFSSFSPLSLCNPTTPAGRVQNLGFDESHLERGLKGS